MCAGTSPRAAPSAERWPWLRLISYGMLDLRSPRQHSRLRSSAVLRCARGLQGDLVVTTETCPQRRILQAKGAPTRADLHMACTTKYVNKVRFKTNCFTFLFILRKTTSRQKTTWYFFGTADDTCVSGVRNSYFRRGRCRAAASRGFPGVKDRRRRGALHPYFRGTADDVCVSGVTFFFFTIFLLDCSPKRSSFCG